MSCHDVVLLASFSLAVFWVKRITQTIANKKLIEINDPQARAETFAGMRAVNSDPDKRREYLYTQAMFKSLDDAAAIA